MRRRTFLTTTAAAWTMAWTHGPFCSAQEPPIERKPALRPPSLTPTPAEKIKRLKSIPADIAASGLFWKFRDGIQGESAHGEIVAVDDVGVTLYDPETGGFHDAVIAEFTDDHQAAIARFRRLLENKAAPDERKLLGSYKFVDPKPDYLSPDAKRFTIKSLQSCLAASGLPQINQPYSCDVTSNPKTLDLFGRQGIFEFRGDELRVSQGIGGGRPVNFDRQRGRDLLVLRRLPDVSSLPAPTADQYDPELKSCFEVALKLVETEDWDACLKHTLPASFLSQAAPADLALMRTALTVEKATSIAILRGLLRVVPTMKSEGTIAEFDFSNVHADGISPEESRKATKIDGRWYLDF